jgi:hypothetical protein
MGVLEKLAPAQGRRDEMLSDTIAVIEAAAIQRHLPEILRGATLHR